MKLFLPRARRRLIAIGFAAGSALALFASPTKAADKPTADTSAANAAPSEVTFCRDIAPILWTHCVECHRAGQVAPFPLTSYEDAAKRAGHLVEVTQSRLMPPWKAEPDVGHFIGERRLTDNELDQLARWEKSGTPQGTTAELPPLPDFNDGWQLGEPDLVLEMPEEFEIPAEGRNVFRWFAIPVNLPEDRMLKAVVFRPGNPQIVHHSLLFFDVLGSAARLDASDPKPGYESFGGPGFLPTGFLGSWSPGFSARALPETTGIWLPAKAVVALQMHYSPTGKPERDRSQIGLYFADSATAVHPVTMVPVMNTNFEIPAGEAAHKVYGSISLPVDCTVIGLNPHMHYVGSKMRVTAISPEGKGLPLISIVDWDFNWQEKYQLAEGIPLTKGTTLEVEAVYDNSANNVRNPHSPPQLVRYGQKNTDEMCLAGVQVIVEGRPQLSQLVGALIRAYLTSRDGKPYISPFE